MGKKLYQQIGNQIKTYRKLTKLTQAELAEKADLSDHFLGFIERGDAKPTLESLEKIASALGIEISELFRFPQKPEYETKELTNHINRLLKRCDLRQLCLFRNLMVEILGAFSTSK